jgi:hypothetical protein
VLVDNTPMMRVFQRAGHQLKVKTSAGIEEVTMLFPDYMAEQLLAARGYGRPREPSGWLPVPVRLGLGRKVSPRPACLMLLVGPGFDADLRSRD